MSAAALALLAYDAGAAALDARHAGRPWLYPASVCAICLLLLAGLGLRLTLRTGRKAASRRG